nr:hypothetical protein [Tanacetum cinerariifolium]
MPPKAKSAVATDNTWTPGRSKNPDVCILKDTNEWASSEPSGVHKFETAKKKLQER